MIKYLLICLAGLPLCSATYAHPSTFIKTAEIVNFFNEHPNVIWDSFNFNDGPIVVHNGTPELLAFNLYPQEEHWEKVTDLAHLAWITRHDAADLHHIGFHPSYPIENKLAFVYGFKSDYSMHDRNYQAFVHEKFHGFQFLHFKNIFIQDSMYQDHLNTDIQQLLFFENKALAALLADLSSVENMKDVIAVYETRRPIMQEKSRVWEDWQLRMEGIAEYVDVDTFLKLPILDVSPLQLLDYYTQRNFSWLSSEPINVVDSAIKWRNYSVGAISALALDELKIDDWKEKVEQGATPMELLSTHFNLNKNEIKNRFKRIKSKWNDPSYLQKIADEIQAYNNILDAIGNEYERTPGVEIQWKIFSLCPSGANMDKSYYLANGGMVSLNMTTHQACYEDNGSFNLEMIKQPIVYENNHKEGQRYKVAGSILIDGQPFSELPNIGVFKQFDINSATVKLSYTGQACYLHDGNRLEIFECL